VSHLILQYRERSSPSATLIVRSTRWFLLVVCVFVDVLMLGVVRRLNSDSSSSTRSLPAAELLRKLHRSSMS
jgi:hypothetical protein